MLGSCGDRTKCFHYRISIDLDDNDNILLTYQIALLDAFKGEGGGR